MARSLLLTAQPTGLGDPVAGAAKALRGSDVLLGYADFYPHRNSESLLRPALQPAPRASCRSNQYRWFRPKKGRFSTWARMVAEELDKNER